LNWPAKSSGKHLLSASISSWDPACVKTRFLVGRVGPDLFAMARQGEVYLDKIIRGPSPPIFRSNNQIDAKFTSTSKLPEHWISKSQRLFLPAPTR